MADSSVDLILTYEDIQVRLMIRRPEDKAGQRTARAVSSVSQPVRAGEQFATQEQLSLYKDYSGGAGWGERVAENVYHWDEPGYSRIPGVAMPPGRLTEIDLASTPVNGAFRGAFEARNDIFFTGGRNVLRVPKVSGSPFLAQDLGLGFEAYSAVNWNGDGYVGGTGGNTWRYINDSDTWVQLGDVRRQFLYPVYWVRGNVGRQRLAGSTTTGGSVTYDAPTSSILYADATAPTNEADWSDEIKIGESTSSITGLGGTNQHLYVLKSDGLYDMDDRLYSPNITEYRRGLGEPGSRHAINTHNGHTYFGTRGGMERVSLAQQGVRQDRPQRCGFGFGQPNYSPIAGEHTAIRSSDGGVLSCVYNPTTATSYLVWGIDYRDLGASPPGLSGPLLHHGAEAVIEDCEIQYLHPASIGSDAHPVIYLAGKRVSDGSGRLFVLSQPASGNPIRDHLDGGPMEFANEWVKYLPRDPFGNDASVKDLTQIVIRGDDLGSATIDAYVAINGGAFDADSLGQATSAYQTFGTSGPSDARDLAFKLVGQGSASVPAILKAFEARADVFVEANDVVAYPVEFGPHVQQHRGEWTQDPFLVEEALKSLQGKRVTVEDKRRNQTYTMRMLQGTRLDWVEYPSNDRNGRIAGRCLGELHMRVLDYTWRLDSGKFLDSGLRVS